LAQNAAESTLYRHRPLVLCADDYGLTPGISAGIRELLSLGRVSATSCLVISPFWKVESPALRNLDPNADIGLHIALTEFTPLARMPFLAPTGRLPSPGSLLTRAHSGQLDADEISQEIARQIDAFSQAMGRPPDYIDGHHHVHHFPVVRDALLRQFPRRLPASTSVRISYEPLRTIWWRGIARLRAAMISAGARSLRRSLNAAGIHCNRRFSGVRDFREDAPYCDLFRRFIRSDCLGELQGLAIMCHPGYRDRGPSLDNQMDAREAEIAYFSGNEFMAELEVASMRLGRFRDLREYALATPG
jgi:predicted glycoside hydrolase/deacetylase ChbG (UPF0249 family)